MGHSALTADLRRAHYTSTPSPHTSCSKKYLRDLVKDKLSFSHQFTAKAIVPPTLKRMYRVLEKTAFQGFDCSHVFDVVRGSILIDSMEGMCHALNVLSTDKSIRIVRVKDRFGRPTSGGWADCLINIVFVNDPKQHVCEIQLINQTMFRVRTDCGAHESYNAYRTAIEFLDALHLDQPEGDGEEWIDLSDKSERNGDAGASAGFSLQDVQRIMELAVAPILTRLDGIESRLSTMERVVAKVAEQDTQ